MSTKLFLLVALIIVFETLPSETREVTYFTEHKELYRRITHIFPGNKSCTYVDAPQDVSHSDVASDVDECRWEVNMCDRRIFLDQTAYGFANDESSWKFHCDCDDKFYECLKKSSDLPSGSMRKFYFDTVGDRCFREIPGSPGETCGTARYEIVDNHGARVWEANIQTCSIGRILFKFGVLGTLLSNTFDSISGTSLQEWCDSL